MLEIFIYSKKKFENFTIELYALCVLNMYTKFCIKQMLFYNSIQKHIFHALF